MEQVQTLVKSWYTNKAKNETDEYYKFMSLWICINAWLDFESEKTRDREMIDWLKGSESDTSKIWLAFESMLETTVGQNGVQNLIHACPITGDRGSDVIITSASDTDNIIEAIYKIRCNLFHGGKTPSNTRDTKLLSSANLVLSKWVAALVADW